MSLFVKDLFNKCLVKHLQKFGRWDAYYCPLIKIKKHKKINENKQKQNKK